MIIQSFRKKFIMIAMSAMTICLILVLTSINILNYMSVVEEQKSILTLIANNDGILPAFGAIGKPFNRPFRMTKESEYQIRYFTVLCNKEHSVKRMNLSRIASVSEEQAADYAQLALEKKNEYGFVDHYIYYLTDTSGGPSGLQRIIFLDWESKLSTLCSFLLSTIVFGILGLLATFVIVLQLSNKAVQPLIVSTQKQQQFITDASHELKTPLSVISVNMDVLSLDVGSNEWIASTNQQIKHLRKLVDQLIAVARMDEKTGFEIEKKTFCFSDVITEMGNYFILLAESRGKTMRMNIAPQVHVNGNEELLRRMVSVLCDNAIKHSCGEGNILMQFLVKKKTCEFQISNSWIRPDDPAVLDRIFDRFYRIDAARAKESAGSGFGIGLSIAQKAAQTHGGAIWADSPDASTICFHVTLRCE